MLVACFNGVLTPESDTPLQQKILDTFNKIHPSSREIHKNHLFFHFDLMSTSEMSPDS